MLRHSLYTRLEDLPGKAGVRPQAHGFLGFTASNSVSLIGRRGAEPVGQSYHRGGHRDAG